MRIALCGRLRVTIGGEALEDRLRGRQGRLLLGYLVLNRGRSVRRDELMAALWPEGAAPGGADALAPLLSRLRSVIGAERLVGRGDVRLELGEGAEVDVEVARADLAAARDALAAGDAAAARDRVQAALGVADGGLLPGVEADWLDAARSELDDLRLGALETLAAAGTRQGGAGLATAEAAARAAVDAAPFRESARVALMQALAAQGNVAEALRVYEDARVLLREELGTAPGAALKDLHARLLRDEPAATAPVAPPVVATASPGLVGRDRERGELGALVRGAIAGDGRVVLLEGPAGIGKSRLLAEARREAEAAGAAIAAARASRLEAEFPFGVVRQLFEAGLADPAARERALAGAAASAAPVFATLDAPGADGAGFAALHGLYWLALNLAAERPLALVVDDLHWCDVPSLRFLAYLARRVEGQPLVLLTALRSGEPPTDPTLAAEVAEDAMTAVVRPGAVARGGGARARRRPASAPTRTPRSSTPA